MADQMSGASVSLRENLSAEIEALDAQHIALFNCLDMLEAATQEKNTMRTCYFLERLSNCIHQTFAEEAFQLRVHDYPRLSDHLREHRQFADELYQLRRTYLDRNVTVEMVVALRDLLEEHVSQSDLDYVPYLTPARRLLPLMPAAVDL